MDNKEYQLEQSKYNISNKKLMLITILLLSMFITLQFI